MTYFGLAKLFIISLFIPGEFHVNLSGLRLELYRVILAFSVIGGVSKIISGKIQYKSTDKCILVATCWGVMSLLINHGFGSGTEKAGIFAIEVMGAYFLARFAITDNDKLITIYRRLIVLVMLFLIPSLMEMITGKKVIHNFAESITGNIVLSPSLYTEDYIRMGMTRSTSAFSHPILNGVICVAAMPFAVFLYLQRKSFKRFLGVAGIFISVVSALSSAPLLVLVVDVMIAIYVITKRKLEEKIKYVVFAAIAIAAIIQLVSNRGIVKLIIHTATFNPHTGTHRLLIIEHLKDDIMRAPFFGSGLGAHWTAPFWMGQSIDNFWWAIAFIYGIPFSVIIAFTGFLCLYKIEVSPIPQKSDNLAYAVKASILSLMVLGLTVHLFDKIHPLFYFAMGSSVYLFKKAEEKKLKLGRRK